MDPLESMSMAPSGPLPKDFDPEDAGNLEDVRSHLTHTFRSLLTIQQDGKTICREGYAPLYPWCPPKRSSPVHGRLIARD